MAEQGSEDPQDERDLDPDEPAQARSAHELARAETAELVSWAQAGDVGALNELFTRHYQTMLEVARRQLGSKLRTKEDPDDLAQTTFREATRDFANYTWRGEGSLLRWLIQILQNKIRDRAEFYSATKRDASKERSLEGAPSSDGEPAPLLEPPSKDLTVTMEVARGESFEYLRAALDELSPLHRKAITLVFFQGLSLREAGEQMGGRTEDAVRMMLRRAEGRLHELLRRSLGKDLDRP